VTRPDSPWKTLSSRLVYDNPWIRLDEHQVVNPGGVEGIYGLVHFKSKSVGVLAIDADDHVTLVGQHRYPLGYVSWELPEGGAEPNETPLEAAQRELQEEAGLVAEHWELMCRLHPSNSVTDEEAFIFLATQLSPAARAPEASETDMVNRSLPFSDVLDLVMRGDITDAMTVTATLRYAYQRKLATTP